MIWLQKDTAFSTNSLNDSRSPRHSGSFYSTGSGGDAGYKGDPGKRGSVLRNAVARLLVGRQSAPLPSEDSVANKEESTSRSSWRNLLRRSQSERPSDLGISVTQVVSAPSSASNSPKLAPMRVDDAMAENPAPELLSKPNSQAPGDSKTTVTESVTSADPSRVASPAGSEDDGPINDELSLVEDVHIRVLAMRIGDVGSAHVVSMMCASDSSPPRPRGAFLCARCVCMRGGLTRCPR